MKGIFKELGSSDVEPLSVRRVGSVHKDKTRPLKVKLDDSLEKAELLKKAKSLRHSSMYRNVYLSNDLTKFQGAFETPAGIEGEKGSRGRRCHLRQ